MNFNIIVISHFNKQIVLDKLILEHQNLSYLDLKRLIYDENLYSRINFSKLNSSDFNILEIYPTSKILINSASKFLNLKPEKTIMKTTLQILSKLKPEIIILRDFDAFSIDEINNLKFNGTIKSKTVLLNGYPLRNKNNYSKFDHVVFRLPYLLENFKNICKNSNLIYHCFNKNILKKLFNKKFENKSRELTFLGSSYSHGFYQHRKRYYYLYNLLKKNQIKVWVDENTDIYQKITFINYLFYKKIGKVYKTIILSFLSILIFILKSLLKKYYKRLENIKEEIINFDSKDFEKFYAGPLKNNFDKNLYLPKFGNDYFNIINDSKISLNIHTESMPGSAGNIRMFEITGVGSCLLTENFNNIPQLFDIDREVVCYNNLNDLHEKISFLKKNPNVVKNISLAGQKKTLNSHCEENRIKEFNDLFLKLII